MAGAGSLHTYLGTAPGVGKTFAMLTGGGFGGCVVALVPVGRAAQVRRNVTDRFTRRHWPAPRYLDAVPSDGAGRLR